MESILTSTGAKLWQQRRHLLDTCDLDKQEIDCFLEASRLCKESHLSGQTLDVLSGQTVANIFYENSTRTRMSFEVAAQRLGAYVLNLDVNSSSVAKGETIVDTARQLVSMGVNCIVQRHKASGAAHLLAQQLGEHIHIVNAGDGWHAHPTQALLDLVTMTSVRPQLAGVKVAIIGDITHSRVARSNIWLLNQLGAKVHVSGPPTLMPAEINALGVTVHNTLDPAVEGADFVMVLRLQLERQTQGLVPSIGEYRRLFRLDHSRLKLAKPEAYVLHPGPVNRNIEITDELVDDPERSLVATQVQNGVAARMAILLLLLAKRDTRK